MNTLITPQEVVDIAFPTAPYIDKNCIGESVILSAQQKFIRPVLNGLYVKMEEGAYGDLLERYVKPALAHYVKFLVIPSLSVQMGTVGVVQPKGSGFASAGDRTVSAVRKRVRSDASALMRKAVEHIERNRKEYPEYDSNSNVLKRLSIESGILI